MKAQWYASALIIKHGEMINISLLMLNLCKWQFDHLTKKFAWILLQSLKCTFYHSILPSNLYCQNHRSDITLISIQSSTLDFFINKKGHQRGLSICLFKKKLKFPSGFAMCQSSWIRMLLNKNVETTIQHMSLMKMKWSIWFRMLNKALIVVSVIGIPKQSPYYCMTTHF